MTVESFRPLFSDTPRAKAAARRRAEIVELARGLFQAHGYEAVTVRVVATAAKCSTGVLFNNWAGKDELFTEAMGRPPLKLTDAQAVELMTIASQHAPGSVARIFRP